MDPAVASDPHGYLPWPRPCKQAYAGEKNDQHTQADGQLTLLGCCDLRPSRLATTCAPTACTPEEYSRLSPPSVLSARSRVPMSLLLPHSTFCVNTILCIIDKPSHSFLRYLWTLMTMVSPMWRLPRRNCPTDTPRSRLPPPSITSWTPMAFP